MPNYNRLTISPTSISLTYNIFDGSTVGNNNAKVIATYQGIDGLSSQDTFEIFSDIIFRNDSDLQTFLYVNINQQFAPTNVGDFVYYILLVGDNSTIQRSLTVYLKVIDSDNTPPPPPIEPEFKTKYIIERTEESDYYLEIQQNTIFELEPIEINGKVEYSCQSKSDLLDTIVASNLKMYLESSIDLNLENLYTEEENQYRVILKKGNDTLFIGFLKPDGIWEDYVSDRWELQIQAIDGLSTLKKISFSNSNGTVYTGKRSAISIIYDCLEKTGLHLPIRVNCDVFYEGADTLISTFEQTMLNTERYFQNEQEPMDCESVLNSILKIFNCTLIQQNGEWWIYRAIDLREVNIFKRYIDGIFQNDFTYYSKAEIGSQIDGFENFFCNKNQKKSIAGSVQAYKIGYEYGSANSIFVNPELKLNGSGLNIEGWKVHNNDGQVWRNEDGYGLNSRSRFFDINNVPWLLELDQTIDINAGATFEVSINFTNEKENSYGLRFQLAVGDHYLRDDGSWALNSPSSVYIDNNSPIISTNQSPYRIFRGKGFANFTATIKAPTTGLLKIIIYRDTDPNHNEWGAQEGYFKIHSIYLKGTNNGDIKGIDYTGQRTTKTSTVTKSDITVYNGDSISDLFVGTIYKADADTPTQFWFRTDKPAERKELLSINAEDYLRMSPRPMTIFEGDFYGFVPYLSLILINNFDNKKFQFQNYSYNLDTNITKMNVKEFSDAYLSDEDFRVDVRYNYGQDTKVTILG